QADVAHEPQLETGRLCLDAVPAGRERLDHDDALVGGPGGPGRIGFRRRLETNRRHRGALNDGAAGINDGDGELRGARGRCLSRGRHWIRKACKTQQEYWEVPPGERHGSPDTKGTAVRLLTAP